MSELHAADFPDFVAQVHGHQPFPWQTALLNRVVETGWPELIDVPTGLGKTSVIDVAVFAAALGCPAARRRVFFVVDRRLIVDEAYDHANVLARGLGTAAAGCVARRVADALHIEAGLPPVEVARMRGGVTWSWRWLERPDQHAVVVGTVDQIGSRLFFRGYGVGEYIRPIDAALVGTDSLIIVDEAHLADAFHDNVRTAYEADSTPEAIRPTVVAMSASPGNACADVHTISDADSEDEVARRRLRAAKRLNLVTVKATRKNADQVTAEAMAGWARHLAADAPVVGVVANTVARARAVFELLNAHTPGRCLLLTGRSRPIDRDYLLRMWYGQISTSRARTVGEALYVVATQTVEVGANIDLDALVTESASLLSLIQRLGRLNRIGWRPYADAIVVHDTAATENVYGPARQATVDWLTTHVEPIPHRRGRLPELTGGLNVSPAALRSLTSRIPAVRRAELRDPRPYVPRVLPQVLDTWARTSPPPRPDTPVGPYLHGIERETPQVSVVWRADLQPGRSEHWAAIVDVMPPIAEEAIELPLAAVRRWLRHTDHAADVTDLDTEAAAVATAEPYASTSQEVLRYQPGGNSTVAAPSEIRDGDILVLPAAVGGCDEFGWNPGSTDPVRDIGDLAGAGRSRVSVRLGPALTDAIADHDESLAARVRTAVQEITVSVDGDGISDARCRTLIADTIADIEPAADEPPHLTTLRRLARHGRLSPLDPDDIPGGPPAVLIADRGRYGDDTSPLASSVAGRPMTLRAHQAAVRRRAEQFARAAGLDDATAQAAALAAFLHDEGKRDPRFQVMLNRGDRYSAAAQAEPLAKSGMDPANRDAARRARDRSGYPPRMRHEALSARIAAEHLAYGTGVDEELILHLVASHHGRNRPLLPPVHDPEPQHVPADINGRPVTFDTAATVDWQAPDRFATLTRRYGRWGLARLEAIVRLADIWCSANNEEA